MDYGLRKMNESMTKTEVMLIDHVTWNLKLIAEERDDKNPNLQSLLKNGWKQL